MIQSIPKLTNDGIYDIMVNKEKVQTLILQVIHIKELLSKNSVRMFKVVISDGKHYTPALVSSKLNEKMDSGDIQKNSIVIINDYYLLPSLNKDRLIIRSIDPFCLFSSIIGKPSPISSVPFQSSQKTSNGNGLQFSQKSDQVLSLSQNVTIQSSHSNVDLLSSQIRSISPSTSPHKLQLKTQKQNLIHILDQNQDQTKNYNSNSNQIITLNTNQNLSHPTNQYKNSSENLNLSSNQSELAQQSLDPSHLSSQNTIKKSLFIDIDSLNPYIFNWTILARVTAKSTIFNFETKEGNPGKLFNILMKDKTDSQIRGTFFNDQVDTFFSIIDQDGVYEISGGLIKEKNLKFNSTLHDYEIKFNSSTKFVPIPDDYTIGKLTYQFEKLSSLPNISPNTAVDILGYVISVSPIQKIIFKNNKTAEKRDIVICDDSNVKCDMTLWDEMANDFPNESGFIVAMKEAKLSDFKGRTLSSPFHIAINPSFYQAELLQEWIDKIRSKSDFDFSMMPTISNGGEMSRSFIFLSQINDLQLGINENKPGYGTAFVLFNDILLSKKIYYPACPNPDCKYKGLIRTENHSYFCQRCMQNIENPVFRYMFTAKVQDFSGLTYVNIIGDDQIGSLFTGMNADEWQKETNEMDEIEMKKLIQEKFFNILKVRCRIKSESFNEKKYIKANIISAEELNFAEGALFFASEIEKYS